MKGIVFREFIDFVEDQAGEDVVDNMIEKANPASGAAYTTVGKYDWKEMVDLVVALSEITSTPVPDLLHVFGRHLFGRLQKTYPQFLSGSANAFDFLQTVETKIHMEVLKLCPDAELPTLDITVRSSAELTVVYSSCHPFGDLCVGMIEGCGDHFQEEFEIENRPKENGLDIIVRRVFQQAA